MVKDYGLGLRLELGFVYWGRFDVPGFDRVPALATNRRIKPMQGVVGYGWLSASPISETLRLTCQYDVVRHRSLPPVNTAVTHRPPLHPTLPAVDVRNNWNISPGEDMTRRRCATSGEQLPSVDAGCWLQASRTRPLILPPLIPTVGDIKASTGH